MASLRLKNLSKIFPGPHTALADFNLEVEEGEFIVIVGPSGCGKSTLLRLIAGLETPTSGEIFLGEALVNTLPPSKRDVSLMFQNYALFPHLNIYDNIAFGMAVRGAKSSDIMSQVSRVSESLQLKDILKRFPHEISGGQKQRAALARSILKKPRVYLMDEPLSNLDAKMRTELRRELKETQRALNSTFLYVTHDQTEAMTMGDRIVVLKDGVIQQVASPVDIYEKPENIFVADFMGQPGINKIPCHLENKNSSVSLVSELFILPFEKIWKKSAPDQLRVGIRPENIRIAKSKTDMDGTFSATIKNIESMGAFAYVYLASGNQMITARISDWQHLNIGETLQAGFYSRDIFLFDTTSGQTL